MTTHEHRAHATVGDPAVALAIPVADPTAAADDVAAGPPALEVRGAAKAFGRVEAVRGADLAVPRGALVAILGPSGCGKTTLLRCVAGFERLDAGVIEVHGRVVDDGRSPVPPHRRRVAVAPQEGALFPHLSVAANVAYGLDRAGRRSGRVDEVLDLVGLSGLGRRMPHELSGGQQQRVAAARALAPRPPLVLFDEPFNALDAGLRAELRADIRAALRADGATAVLVTHDQDEALSIADRVAVMRDGRILQTAPPHEVYRRPADPWVAAFVGSAVLLPATVTGHGLATTALGAVTLAEPAAVMDRDVTVLVRPEQVRVTTDHGVAAVVVDRLFHGHDVVLTLRAADGGRITARAPSVAGSVATDARPGDAVRVTVAGTVWAWPA